MKKREFLKLGAAAGLSLGLGPVGEARAQSRPGVLRVAMTAADIPLTTGQPSQGAEGVRFMGITLYDGLTRWDLSHGDRAARIVPGLAESWTVDPQDKRVWTFRLRRGVRFHDGSTFTADAVVWNLDKLLNKAAPQFDLPQATQGSLYTGGIASWRKIDESTVEITTKVVDAVLPYSLASVFMSSPARWEEMGRDWNKVAQKPSGTGPWRLESVRARERAELVRNPDHWDTARIPKSERLVLIPMPDVNSRVAALLSGQVDFVEAPPPDAIPRLRQAKMQIVTNVYPHIWPYMLSFEEGSPFLDVRVRRAANMAIDREGLVSLLGGLAAPAKGMIDPGHPWFGKPTLDLGYNPDRARALLAEAGFGKDRPVRARIIISPSGSGQMQPLPMNEFIKENLQDVGITVEFEVMDWETLRTRRRLGAAAPENKGRHGINNSFAYWDPDIGLIGPASRFMKDSGFNWGGYYTPRAEALAKAAKQEFDPEAQNALLGKLHEVVVEDAMWIFVVHDLNPRALAPNVTGFVQAQSWLQDLTPVVVA
ncbi:ABC transporter substrate-binding protein [Methylobacterium variabile]|uniref:ABC transporter substrate-binding protein n=1 Tax=Methylobacterium variabile TaxID=298794 RepID=A0A0J6T330_9HYPH|nr:ABC transporter substrate-binding protein [Methylobacterium variabile]KMO40369.1 ABC transporter substrate-binding protein [Methylobacterium variabile]